MELSVRTEFKDVLKDINLAPKQVSRAALIGINKAAERVRIDSGTTISDKIQPRRGAKRLVKSKIKTIKARGNTLTATVIFNERGFGIEQTAKATVRKVRGKGGRYTVSFKGKQINKAFRVGSKKAVLVRTKGRIERLFSYTLLQEARKAKVFTKGQQEALDIAVSEFSRQLKLFS